jgi:hypothetical protein
MLSLVPVRLAAACIVLLLVGCADCPPWQAGHPIIMTRSGVHLCAAHHAALVTVPGFQMCGEWPIIDSVGGRHDAENCNPNHVSSYESLQKDATFCKPCKVTYCPTCEANMLVWLRRHGFREH